MKNFARVLVAVAAVLLNVASSHGAIVDDYTFDTLAGTDAVGGTNGTWTGSPAAAATAQIGSGAADFNGTTWLKETTGLTPATFQHGTISLWVNGDLPVAGAEIIGGRGKDAGGPNQLYWGLRFDELDPGTAYGGDPLGVYLNFSDEFQIKIKDSDLRPAFNGPNSFWHNLTFAWDAATNTGHAYVDGVEKTFLASGAFPAIPAQTNFTMLGSDRNQNPAPGAYVGAYDDISTWNTTLNSTQVAALVSVGAGLGANAKDVNALFNFYSTGSGTYTDSKGNVWSKYGSGTAFDGTGALSAPLKWTGATSTTWSGEVGTNNWQTGSSQLHLGANGGVQTGSGGAVADYADAVPVTFDDTATGATVADINLADVRPTSVTFNNSSKSFSITGAFGLAGAATTVTKQGTGTVTMGSVNTYGGVTTVEAGKLILQGTAKAMVPVISNGGANVKGGTLVLDYLGQADPVTNVKSLLTASYNAGAWNTGKFQSSTATSARGLGWSDNTGTSKINVAYTLYGDANLDGTTNFTDLSKLLSKYNQAGVWSDGDFNYDGTVNFLDLSKMLSNYNQSVGTLTPSPEPSSLILLVTSVALMGGWLIRRRNRVA